MTADHSARNLGPEERRHLEALTELMRGEGGVLSSALADLLRLAASAEEDDQVLELDANLARVRQHVGELTDDELTASVALLLSVRAVEELCLDALRAEAERRGLV